MSEPIAVRTVPVNPGPKAFFHRTWYLIVAVVVFLSCYGWWWAFSAFSDQGYAPLQPIPFSHRLHAGEHGIDCTYCHFNAERSKHAGVPPISICAGCHHPDQGRAGAGKPGVEQLLALIKAKEGQLETTYLDSEDADGMGTGQVAKAGGRIHWNRIHKLPDHVYFRHEWHVKAGVACQTCHGKVEEMEVVRQDAPLTMGWCIECHRKDTYVGGPNYDGSDATFTVGTANYDVLRARIQPDQVVAFEERTTKGQDAAGHDHHGHDHHGHDNDTKSGGDHRELRGSRALSEELDQLTFNRSYFSIAQSEALKKSTKINDQNCQDGAVALPRWRVPDLPSLHAQFYSELKSKAELDAMPEAERNRWLKANIKTFDSFQNAPTQCSTCHQ